MQNSLLGAGNQFSAQVPEWGRVPSSTRAWRCSRTGV